MTAEDERRAALGRLDRMDAGSDLGDDDIDAIRLILDDIAHLESENIRLSHLLAGRFREARLMRAGPMGKGAFELDIRSGLSGIMAENMASILDGEGAPNFVQVEADHPERGPLTFTVARRFGRSPSVQLAAAKAEIAKLKAEIATRESESGFEAERW